MLSRDTGSPKWYNDENTLKNIAVVLFAIVIAQSILKMVEAAVGPL